MAGEKLHPCPDGPMQKCMERFCFHCKKNTKHILVAIRDPNKSSPLERNYDYICSECRSETTCSAPPADSPPDAGSSGSSS